MNRVTFVATTLLFGLVFTGVAISAEYTVGQKNKKFTTKELKIKLGDKVHFTNEDPFVHNVYSLSDIKTFDLGSYPRGKSKAVVFDKAGKIPVECAIHPNMYMEIIIEE
ncbi:MAG: methylamine utilization protein [Gammaproteobacteria bacterium]|nr:methylamine utilization protein [Gammaproteobacteria bacterium]